MKTHFLRTNFFPFSIFIRRPSGGFVFRWSECNLEVLEDCNLAKISRVTPGFVGADLSELVKKAEEKYFSPIPSIKWEDVGGLDFQRREFEEYIANRISTPRIMSFRME
ncbi:hypothetical protein C5167_000383 [Papaver somniferum]|uniref:AAA ATPase AAA+ lid domain-containing protein n=1 Tax=Papaver somniferum TaxID=3469 RepID=A0A4Y7KWH2_PAPSO|nr:hypothetical protein C5167_000383 [Papaver somniferum]